MKKLLYFIATHMRVARFALHIRYQLRAFPARVPGLRRAPRSEQVDAGALWDDAGHPAGGPRRSAGTLLGTVRLTGESGKNRVCRNFQDQTGAVLLPQLRSLRCTFVVSLYCPEGFNSSSHCFGGILMVLEATEHNLGNLLILSTTN